MNVERPGTKESRKHKTCTKTSLLAVQRAVFFHIKLGWLPAARFGGHAVLWRDRELNIDAMHALSLVLLDLPERSPLFSF